MIKTNSTITYQSSPLPLSLPSLSSLSPTTLCSYTFNIRNRKNLLNGINNVLLGLRQKSFCYSLPSHPWRRSLHCCGNGHNTIEMRALTWAHGLGWCLPRAQKPSVAQRSTPYSCFSKHYFLIWKDQPHNYFRIDVFKYSFLIAISELWEMKRRLEHIKFWLIGPMRPISNLDI